MAKNKKILQEEAKKEFIKQKKQLMPLIQEENYNKQDDRPPHILDRFLPKPKIK